MDGQLSLFDGFLEKPKTEVQKNIEKAQTTLLDMAKSPEKTHNATKSANYRATIEEAINRAKSQGKLPQTNPANKKTAEVIQFPKPKPEVKPTPTQGNATYDDCKKKFAADLSRFKDNDSQYVINGLLELCKVDRNFCNRVMLKNKSYSGAYKYMATKAQNGIGAYRLGNMAIMDKDTALGICIDYYNELG